METNHGICVGSSLSQTIQADLFAFLSIDHYSDWAKPTDQYIQLEFGHFWTPVNTNRSLSSGALVWMINQPITMLQNTRMTSPAKN